MGPPVLYAEHSAREAPLASRWAHHAALFCRALQHRALRQLHAASGGMEQPPPTAGCTRGEVGPFHHHARPFRGICQPRHTIHNTQQETRVGSLHLVTQGELLAATDPGPPSQCVSSATCPPLLRKGYQSCWRSWNKGGDGSMGHRARRSGHPVVRGAKEKEKATEKASEHTTSMVAATAKLNSWSNRATPGATRQRQASRFVPRGAPEACPRAVHAEGDPVRTHMQRRPVSLHRLGPTLDLIPVSCLPSRAHYRQREHHRVAI